MTRALALVVLLLLHPASWARDIPLQIVGEARLQFMFWPVYDSRLYSVDGGFREGQRPLRFEIEYLRAVAAQDLVEHTRNEWQRRQSLTAQEQRWLQALSRLWPDVGANDVLALELDQQGGSTFLHNGAVLGTIEDPAFGERFLGIWLAPDTSRPALRDDLLGMN